MTIADTLREARRIVEKQECSCMASDAWRCARLLNLRTIACYCPCHKYLQPSKPEEKT